MNRPESAQPADGTRRANLCRGEGFRELERHPPDVPLDLAEGVEHGEKYRGCAWRADAADQALLMVDPDLIAVGLELVTGFPDRSEGLRRTKAGGGRDALNQLDGTAEERQDFQM